MVKELLEKEIRVWRGASDQVLGQLKESTQQVLGQVGPWPTLGPTQQVRDDKEPPARNDLLLDGCRGLHQVADETHQFGTEGRISSSGPRRHLFRP